MSIVVRAFPIKGSRADLDAFIAELNGKRKADATSFYRQFNLKHESWHLQQTPAGAWVIVVSVIAEDPQAAGSRYAAATEEFHTWFKGQVLRITGVDANVDPLGPPTERIFHWSDAGDFQPLLA